MQIPHEKPEVFHILLRTESSYTYKHPWFGTGTNNKFRNTLLAHVFRAQVAGFRHDFQPQKASKLVFMYAAKTRTKKERFGAIGAKVHFRP